MKYNGIIRWNSGAEYSEHGQRMAAAAVSDGVVLVDIDRGLDYFFRDCPLVAEVIYSRYLNNEGEGPIQDASRRNLIKQLERYAATGRLTKREMSQAALDFLSTMLEYRCGYNDCELFSEEDRQQAAALDDATVFDFSRSFVALAERFIDGFIQHAAHAGVDAEAVGNSIGRTLGGGLYMALNGSGCQFSDYSDTEELQPLLESYASGSAFEHAELWVHDSDNAHRRVDLPFNPSAIALYRAKLFEGSRNDRPKEWTMIPEEEFEEVEERVGHAVAVGGCVLIQDHADDKSSWKKFYVTFSSEAGRFYGTAIRPVFSGANELYADDFKLWTSDNKQTS